jgi:hypothetical protein
MASAIRHLGLKIIVTLLRVFVRPAPAGWRRSNRPTDLTGR